jgi:acetylornithine deacetylase/succinyl-diaminopimelate desuccinylase-like protein
VTSIAPLDWLKSNSEESLNELKELLRIPSVSTQPARKKDVQRCAESVSQLLTRFGLEKVTIHPTKLHPVVTAEWCHQPNAPTILLYGHYDVQPETPVELWNTPPFEPTIIGGQIIARGVSDNKGMIFAHIKAIQAWLESTGSLPVNVKVIIEGEEEIGSPNLIPFVEANQKLLEADMCLISDNPMFAKDTPSVCTSLRGLGYMEIEATGANSDLHSGQHGGTAPNPIHALASILTQLKDQNNRITIPGFYDNVARLSSAQKKAFSQLPYSTDKYKEQLGVSDLWCETDYSPLECMWTRPTLDCNGIFGGYTDEGAKTVIPAKASMKVSMRLVDDQDPVTIMKEAKSYIHKLCPSGITLSIQDDFGYSNPASTDPAHPAVQAALKALKDTFGKNALLQGEGGSIPIVSELKRILGIDTVLIGMNLPEDKIHAPNEQLSLDNFQKGMETSVRFWENIGMIPD